MQYNHWSHDLKDSVIALESIKNIISTVISGRIHTIESVNNEVLILLDQKSGIDYIREDAIGLQGIAARAQWGKAWNTFTIRSERHTGSKTELEKRTEQIENGYFYPQFTLQAYFKNKETNQLSTLGIIKTKELYEFIEKNPDKVEENKSDNKFIFVQWIYLGGIIKTIPLFEKLYPKENDILSFHLEAIEALLAQGNL